MASIGPPGAFLDQYGRVVSFDPNNSNLLIVWGYASPVSGGAAAPGPIAAAAATGVNPVETSYALYGHNIPLLVLGRERVGGDIISGPVIDTGLAYGINSFGVQADPTRTLTLIEIAFDSDVVWEGSCVGDPSGPVTPDPTGFRTEVFTCRFYTGSLTQSADSLETAAYGANAVAYVGQVLLAIDGLPLANTKFKKYPYISGRFVDQDGEAINFGEAFERLAYGPYVGLTSAQFETVDITDGSADGGFIITQDAEFLGLIQQYGRFYRNWDILQTDKLRIVDRGADTTPDIVLDKSNLMGQVTIARAEPDSIPRELILQTIDPDADYTIVPSKASFPRDAVAVSSSVKTETQYLPMVMDAATRQAVVTFTKYSEEIARKRITCTAMIRGLEIEPGALLGLTDLATGISDETYKVKETTHGANHTVEIVAESFMDCQTSPVLNLCGDPVPSMVSNLMGWYDASCPASLTLSGFDIHAVADGSGNGNNMVKVGSSNWPQYQSTGFNGGAHPYFLFTSSDIAALGTPIAFPMGSGNTLTAWYVGTFSIIGGSAGGRVMSYAVNGGSDFNNAGFWNVNANSSRFTSTLERNLIDNTSNTGTGDPDGHRLIFTIDSAGAMTTYLDGVANAASSSPGNWTPGGGLCLGVDAYGGSQFWRGRLAEAGVALSYTSPTNVAALDLYLKNKWGL